MAGPQPNVSRLAMPGDDPAAPGLGQLVPRGQHDGLARLGEQLRLGHVALIVLRTQYRALNSPDSALTQQHHLDALALRGMSFPMQRCFQTPNLLFGAFDVSGGPD